jgi:ATP-dependent protease HslVU (ClpYQ) peptidase subunit
MIAALWKAIGEPNLSDWRFGMTTCIAAITVDRLIVTASDTGMAFGEEFSVGDVIKLEGFHGEWAALIAGSDVSQAPFVIERARRNLQGKIGELRTVKDEFKRAYQDQLREVLTDEFLSPFDMTLEDFKRKGRRQLDPTVHQSLSFGIKNAKLGCKFLVYGFDAGDESPHLFEIGGNGKIESRDKPGFWAIGSGAVSAISMMAHLGQSSEATRMRETLYNVLAAKYISESASNVGEGTFLFIKRMGCNSFSHSPGMEKDIKRVWKERGRPTIPPEALGVIDRADIRFPPVFKAGVIKP